MPTTIPTRLTDEEKSNLMSEIPALSVSWGIGGPKDKVKSLQPGEPDPELNSLNVTSPMLKGPGGGTPGRDSKPITVSLPEKSLGPVRIVLELGDANAVGVANSDGSVKTIPSVAA